MAQKCQKSKRTSPKVKVAGIIMTGLVVIFFGYLLLGDNGATIFNLKKGDSTLFIGDKDQKNVLGKEVTSVKNKTGKTGKTGKTEYNDYSIHDYSVKDSYNTTNPVEKETETVIEKEVVPEKKEVKADPERIIQKEEGTDRRSLENQGTDGSGTKEVKVKNKEYQQVE